MKFLYHTIIPRIFRSLKPEAWGMFILLALPVYGRDSFAFDKDSVVKKFPEIQVSADRLSKPALEFSAVTALSGKKIEELGAKQISDAIAFVPGVYIKNYGGLGGLKTVSVRGTSSSQTIVMINGLKINSAQSGTYDLSSLPISSIDKIEVMRGGNSALYGGGSMGGAVNLITSGLNGRRTAGSLYYGSFSDVDASLSIGSQSGDLGYGSGIYYQRTAGDYPFSYNRFGKTTIESRKNADFSNFLFSPKFNYDISGWQISQVSFLRAGTRGSPGAVLQGRLEETARIDEKEVLVIISAKTNFKSNLLFNAGLLGKVNGFNYTNNGGAGTDKNNNYTNRELQFNSSLSYNDSNFTCEGNFEAVFTDLRGKLNAEMNNYADRGNIGVSGRIERAFNITNFGLTRLEAGVRADIISGIGTAISPLAGISFAPDGTPLKLKIQYSKNFRAPSFNELYYENFGSTDLKPEKSDSYSAGIDCSISDWLEVSLYGYFLNSENQIIAVPRNQNSWSAHNLGKSETKGLEASVSGVFFRNSLRATLSYTRQQALDMTPNTPNYGDMIEYIPQEIASGMISYSNGLFTMGANGYYSSFRYSLPSNSIESVLPSYFSLNIFAEAKVFFAESIKLRIEANNVFDKRYEVVKNYPMPGRSFRAGIRFEI